MDERQEGTMGIGVRRRTWIRNSVALGAGVFFRGGEVLLAMPAPEEGDRLLPFADVKPPNPERPALAWENLAWMTPKEQLFSVGHYGTPEVDTAAWKLEIGGLVRKPRTFTLAELKTRPRREYTLTIECSGNSPTGGLIGNQRWAGTPLAP